MARLSIRGNGYFDAGGSSHTATGSGARRKQSTRYSSQSHSRSGSHSTDGQDEDSRSLDASSAEQSDSTDSERSSSGSHKRIKLSRGRRQTSPEESSEEEESGAEEEEEEEETGSDEEDGESEASLQTILPAGRRIESIDDRSARRELDATLMKKKRRRRTASVSSGAGDQSSQESDGVEASRPSKAAKSGPSKPVKARNWRKYAKQERDLVCRKGGLIWQAARPLLEDMPAKERNAAAAALQEVTRALDTTMQTALAPGPVSLPRHSRRADNTTQSFKVYERGTLSSLMNWVLSTGGTLPQDGDDDDGAGQAAIDRPKGFDADKRLLEQWLMPEINEMVTLQRAMEAQEQELHEAIKEINHLRSSDRRLEEAARTAHNRASSLLHDAMAKTQDDRTSKSLDKMLRETASRSLLQQNND